LYGYQYVNAFGPAGSNKDDATKIIQSSGRVVAANFCDVRRDDDGGQGVSASLATSAQIDTQAAILKLRTRLETNFSKVEGIQCWGLQE
jgi:hypothetical protein